MAAVEDLYLTWKQDFVAAKAQFVTKEFGWAVDGRIALVEGSRGYFEAVAKLGKVLDVVLRQLSKLEV